MRPKEDEVLIQPISDLQLSKECQSYLERLGVRTLCDFICKGWNFYKKDENLEPRSFNEVVSYLEKRDLLHLMEGI
jgi:DNA-directed RNA polymerase alpha subunit